MEIRNILSSVYKNDDKFKKQSDKNPDVIKKDKIEKTFDCESILVKKAAH